jgi:hypothetical protein
MGVTGRVTVIALAAAMVTGCTHLRAGTARLDSAGLVAGCPGQALTTRVHARLDETIGTANPRRLPIDPDRTENGPVSDSPLISANIGKNGDQRVHQQLTGAGFTDGFHRRWEKGEFLKGTLQTDAVNVFRFRTGRGACDFAAWVARELALTSTVVPYSVTSVAKGAVGLSRGADPLRTAIVVASRGRYVVVISAFGQRGDQMPWAGGLLTAAYRNL